MAWARFVADFRWPPRGPWHVTYRAGQRRSVTGDCLQGAIAAGAGAAIKTPPKSQVDQLKADPYWTPPAKTPPGEAS